MTFPPFYSENFLRENSLKISKIPELSRIFVDNLENYPNFDFFYVVSISGTDLISQLFFT